MNFKAEYDKDTKNVRYSINVPFEFGPMEFPSYVDVLPWTRDWGQKYVDDETGEEKATGPSWILRLVVENAFPDAEDGKTFACSTVTLRDSDIARNPARIRELVRNKVECALLSLKDLLQSRNSPVLA